MPLLAIETELLGSPTLLSSAENTGNQEASEERGKAAAMDLSPGLLLLSQGYKINIFILWNYYNCLPMRHLKGTCWLLFIQTHYCWITVERK